MLAALLAAASPQSVVDAERAFAKAATVEGQWTAFRRFAAPDAVMFVPEQVNAQAWLKDRADPARSVTWQPRRAWLSCDGNLAVTTGNWQRPTSAGYFTTVWRRQADGRWHWIFDHGDALAKPRRWPESLTIERASCRRPIGHLSQLYVLPEGTKGGAWPAADGTMLVSWDVMPDGARHLRVEQAKVTKPGRFKRATYMTSVVDEDVAAPSHD